MNIKPEKSWLCPTPEIKIHWLLVLLMLLASECLYYFVRARGIVIGGPVIPQSLGLIKDLVDVIIILFFPWSGWVLAVPLIAHLSLRTKMSDECAGIGVTATLLASTTITSIISTAFSFSAWDVRNLGGSIITYFIINLCVLFILFIFKLIKGTTE